MTVPCRLRAVFLQKKTPLPAVARSGAVFIHQILLLAHSRDQELSAAFLGLVSCLRFGAVSLQLSEPYG